MCKKIMTVLLIFVLIVLNCPMGGVHCRRHSYDPIFIWGGRVVRWSWVNFQCRGVLLIWIRVGQGPTALAVVAGGGCLDIFTLLYPFSPLSPSLWETARYRLKYCLKGPLKPKQLTNQPIFIKYCQDVHLYDI